MGSSSSKSEKQKKISVDKLRQQEEARIAKKKEIEDKNRKDREIAKIDLQIETSRLICISQISTRLSQGDKLDILRDKSAEMQAASELFKMHAVEFKEESKDSASSIVSMIVEKAEEAISQSVQSSKESDKEVPHKISKKKHGKKLRRGKKEDKDALLKDKSCEQPDELGVCESTCEQSSHECVESDEYIVVNFSLVQRLELEEAQRYRPGCWESFRQIWCCCRK